MKVCRNFIIITSVLSCLFYLSGCKNHNTKPNDIDHQPAGVTLTLEHHESALPENGIAQELAKDFEKQTGIHIEFKEVPDAQWRDLLKAQLTDGSASDIFLVDADPFSLYDRIRPDINCIDLSSEEFVTRMDPSVIPSISSNNKVYGIPFMGKKIWVYSYNKKIFKQLNLKIPSNYQELKDVCKKIKDAGITPMWQVPATGWHQVLPLFELGPYYASQDPKLYDKLNKNKMDIKNVPGLLTVLQEIDEFADLGYYGDEYFGNSVKNEIYNFAAGKVAMVLEEVSWPNQVISEYPNMSQDIGIFIMPWDNNQVLGINPTSNAYFGNKNSQHKEEILQYFRFLAKHENLKKRMKGDPNCYELCWPEIPSRYPKEYTDYLSQFQTGIVMQAGVSYVDAQWMDIGEDIEKMYADLMSPTDVLNEISDRRSKLAKMMKDPNWP